MQKKNNIYYVTAEPDDLRAVSEFLSNHNLKARKVPAASKDFATLEEQAFEYFKRARLFEEGARSSALGVATEGDSRAVICAVREEDTHQFYEAEGANALQKVLSKMILERHSYEATELSCRDDSAMLERFIKNGRPDFSASPKEWIYNNQLFSTSRNTMLERVTNFVLNERGMFLKVWTLNCQKNYWNSTFNGGVPITRKRDALHEGTFLLHDMFHFIFEDPIVTGYETEEERKFYIAYRMMSEACTQVLADMIGIAQTGLKQAGYDTSRRRIFPLFESLNLDPHKRETIVQLMRANGLYCLTGNEDVYLSMGANKEAFSNFRDKYSIYFSVDFEWNEKNIGYLLAESNRGTQKEYMNAIRSKLEGNTVHELYGRTKTHDGSISFESLFSIFLEQFDAMMNYEEEYSQLKFARKATLKHLAGQTNIVFKYPTRKSPELLAAFGEAADGIRVAETVEEICEKYEKYGEIFSRYVQNLLSDERILPHEVTLNELHVPHFPAVYYTYDLDSEHYPPHSEVAERIFSGKLSLTV